MTAKEVLRVLERAGFTIHHHKGSHVHLRHFEKPHLRIVVPSHNRDLAPKTLQTIIAQAEISVDEFLNWM
ncbi:MAG: type II toxin-antitoxin system HicA family toxin [Deltaproteobacteria bacterium]|nr:type II toxin-antitoxin system HicA family toxin [Deltaproteobacteria bacterium]MBF0525894.1 type II toxin-antitoxin system HicA family toxin [Deltaproteobacteria bacterium]